MTLYKQGLGLDSALGHSSLTSSQILSITETFMSEPYAHIHKETHRSSFFSLYMSKQ